MSPENPELAADISDDGLAGNGSGDAGLDGDPARPREQRYPLSRTARISIVVSTIVGGILGYMIAYSVFDIACARSGCGTIVPLLWGFAGALLGIIGCAVVSVLLSRSFAEWNMVRRDDKPVPRTRGPKTC